MRIPGSKPPVIDTPPTREKRASEPSAKPAETAAAPRPDAALSSASLDRVVQEADVASREFEQTIGARLDEVKSQLISGTYAINYDRLAQRLMDEGLPS